MTEPTEYPVDDLHDVHIWNGTVDPACPRCVELEAERSRPPLWSKPKPGAKPRRRK